VKNYLNLDGIWDFAFQEIPLEQVELGNFPVTELMTVPGCYEALPKYFGLRGTGLYHRKVQCSGRVLLRFEGLGLRGKFFWDGKEIGICELPFSRTDLVFDAGAEGEHELAIAVENIAHPIEEGTLFFENYDFYGYGGIYDSVILAELPEYYIERIQVTALDLQGNVEIKLLTNGNLPAKYQAEIAFDGKLVTTKCLSGSENCVVCRVPNPSIWSPEQAHLHRLQMTLDQGMDQEEVNFGIRTIAARDGRLFLNGNELTLIGYNRHDSHPEFGYAVPQSLMLADLTLIKDQGCNFVRGSHYPQREKFLDLCDRMGLLVWEESMGWGNSKTQVQHPDFFRNQVEQTVRMVQKSANHPSVILWGFLNEVHMNESPRKLVSALANAIRENDSSRLVTFAFAGGCRHMGDNCLDLVDVLSFNTYPGWYESVQNLSRTKPLDSVVPMLRELAEFASQPSLKDKPLLIGEIGGAGMAGDHSGYRWSEEYQAELLENALNEVFDNPRYSGIAIWQFCDTKTYIVSSGFLNRPRGFNNKGVVDEYRRPKVAWRRIAEILKKRQKVF